MSEMVEKVADQIARACGSKAEPVPHQLYRDAARAAIEAMREPITYEMRAAAVNVTLPGIGEPPLYEKIWRAMITAALSPSRKDGERIA